VRGYKKIIRGDQANFFQKKMKKNLELVTMLGRKYQESGSKNFFLAKPSLYPLFHAGNTLVMLVFEFLFQLVPFFEKNA
jgi:hypothetical protein